MDMQQLDYFIECASIKSTRMVAQFRYCSPSSVSRQIASLEHELNAQLFHRKTTGMVLTEQGELFLEWALHVREEYRRIVNEIAPYGSADRNEIIIGCYFFDKTYRKLAEIRDFLPSDFGVDSLIVQFVPLGNMVSGVADGTLDCGINNSIPISELGLVFDRMHFSYSPFKLTVGWRHPLYGRTSISAEEVIRYYTFDSFFLPGEMKKYAGAKIESIDHLKELANDYLRAYMHLPGMRNGYFQTVTQIPMFQDSVASGTLMAITVEDLSVHSRNQLCSIPFSNPELAGDTCLFWRKDTTNQKLLRFIESLRDHPKE